MDRLINVHKLNLAHCPNINSIPALKNLLKLILKENQKLSQISHLNDLHSLDIVNCPLIDKLPIRPGPRTRTPGSHREPNLDKMYYLNLYPLEQFNPDPSPSLSDIFQS